MGRPRVTVVNPRLERPHDGGALPHVFPGDALCLYYDGDFDDRADLLVDTVVPWVSEWLYHYELWVATGDWHGGGIHPDTRPNRGGARPAGQA